MRRTSWLLGVGLLAFAIACAGDADDASPSGRDGSATGAFTPGLATAVTTEDAGRTAVVGAETFVSDRTLPAAALSAERLEDAGAATADDGRAVPMARATSEEVQTWELVSPGDAGWVVWMPQVVLRVIEDAGPGAFLTSVEEVDWPDACLGAGGEDEVCAQVITPGYRIIVEQGGETVEYHAARGGDFRRVITLG
jgi:hypothetical protein